MMDEQRVNCVGQLYHQSGEDGAISTVRAATDPSLTGQGFKYFGPWYKGGLVIHTGNESKSSKQHVCHVVYSQLMLQTADRPGTLACNRINRVVCHQCRDLSKKA